MSARPPIAPFELDPQRLEPAQLQLVEAPDAQHPAVVVPDPGDRPRRPWLRLFLGAAGIALLGMLGLEAYDYLASLFARSALLGGLFSALFGLLAIGALGVAAREVLSLRRLARADELRREAAHLVGSEVHGQAQPLLDRVAGLYRDRSEVRDAVRGFEARASDALSDGERLRLFAASVLAPLDRQAYRLVKRGARDIGALTALSPLGLLDGLIVLARTLAMLRAIARLYGIRPSAAATIALVRRTIRNVVAAGVGELVSDAAVETTGASLLSVLSARAGQGAMNGLLAAKLGLAAVQLCRPLPFTEDEIPSLRQLRKELFE